MSPGSIMPNYPWLFEKDINVALTPAKIRAMITLGVPYQQGYDQIANDDLMKQANDIVGRLKADGIKSVEPNKEIIALIAYLQRIGTDIKLEQKTASK
jgi:cytochrome c oxidase cbb3-type subunit I/II